MTIKLISQIDIVHWTVLFLDDKWKDKVGDFRLDAGKHEVGDKLWVKVELYPKTNEPNTIRYCGVIEITPKKKA